MPFSITQTKAIVGRVMVFTLSIGWPWWLSRLLIWLVVRRLWFRPLLGRQHSFMEIDHEILSTVILSLPLIQEGQLPVSVERMCTILVNCLEAWACPVKVWLGKLTALDMTPLVDRAVKPQQKQTLSIETDRPEQTVYTKIRCCRMQHLIRVCTVCNSSNSLRHMNSKRNGLFKILVW